MQFYSSVPLLNGKECPKAADHNRLASQVNRRLLSGGPATAWSIFYFADSIFTNMRNTSTPGIPIGVGPPEDEWWKIYACIEWPTAETGAGNWPLTPAGNQEGANVINPLNAYIFGRVTAENKLINEMGPWAEGNLFDGLVRSSRALLSNSAYWSDSFAQRGAIMANTNYNKANYKKWRKGELKYEDELKRTLSHTKFLPSPYDATYVSKSLFSVGRSSDRYFEEYASQAVYMRYPPAVYGGTYTKYNKTEAPDLGVLKRKNATKDLLQWALWTFVYYFRGSEQQRSLFCEAKDWDAPVVDFNTTEQYIGQQTYGLRRVRERGPLNICKVGFDFFKYMTRQNILAPVLGVAVKRNKGKQPALDAIGNPTVEQYRPKFKFTIKAQNSVSPFLGKVNGKVKASGDRKLNDNKMGYENYDSPEIGELTGGRRYGKALRFSGDSLKASSETSDGTPKFVYSSDANKDMLFKCSFDNGKGKVGSENFNPGLTARNKVGLPFTFAGYYLQTTAVDNTGLHFILRIWKNGSVFHETPITNYNSYAVNRSGRRAWIYNKVFYFKEGISSGTIRFEIVPAESDGFKETMPDSQARTNYIERVNASNENELDKVICFGNPFSHTVTHKFDEKSIGTGSDNINATGNYLMVPSSFVGSGDKKLQSLKMIRIKEKGTEDEAELKAADGEKRFFIKISPDAESGTGRRKIWLSRRQDKRLNHDGGDDFYDIGNVLGGIGDGTLVIEKLEIPTDFFSVSLEPAILLKQRPGFQDAYALLRAATEKSNEANSLGSTIVSDSPGVGTVGHAFSESQQVFTNYLRYGSGQNIYGAPAVPALRQKISSNPIYESVRKFVSSYLRMADRHQLINYTVENGKGVLYFKRYAWKGLGNKHKATILGNMEPSIDPVGRFYEGSERAINDLPYAKYKPILPGKKYYMHIPSKGGKVCYYNLARQKTAFSNGDVFYGVAGKPSLVDADGCLPLLDLESSAGAYEIDGITQNIGGRSGPYGGSTNEWIMFMTSSHYHTSTSHLYKPDIYNDIMTFLNNRCHHRSLEYERSNGTKYDMIREELLRTPTNASNVPSPQLHVFLSKSPPNYNYVFYTNDPTKGNLDIYGVKNFLQAYRQSCPPASHSPYFVNSCKVVNSRQKDLIVCSKSQADFNLID